VSSFDEYGYDPTGAAKRKNMNALEMAGASDDAYDDEPDGRRGSFAPMPPSTQAPASAATPELAPLISEAPASGLKERPPRSNLFTKGSTWDKMPVRNDRVWGQYFSTFKDRQKVTGGGFGGFWNAFLGRGMRRLNDRRIAEAG